MANTVELNIEARDKEKNPRELRRLGFIPGTVYGKDLESVSVQVNAREFVNTYKNNKDSVYKIKVNNKTYSTNIVNVQKNYATNDDLNIEFKVV